MGHKFSKKKAKAANHEVKTPPDPHPSTFGQREDASEELAAAAQKNKMPSTKDFVDSTIKNNKVVVWSKSYCPYCKKAKDAIFSILPKDAVDVEELDHRDDGGDIQDYLAQLTGGRSVPRVFVGGKFIGGGDDTARLKQNGELKLLFEKAGALPAAA